MVLQKSALTLDLHVYLIQNIGLKINTNLKSTNAHIGMVSLLFILGGKSKSMVTFSVRLLVRQSVQLRMDEITGDIGLYGVANKARH